MSSGVASGGVSSPASSSRTRVAGSSESSAARVAPRCRRRRSGSRDCPWSAATLCARFSLCRGRKEAGGASEAIRLQSRIKRFRSCSATSVERVAAVAGRPMNGISSGRGAGERNRFGKEIPCSPGRHLLSSAVAVPAALPISLLSIDRSQAQVIDLLKILVPAAPGGGWDRPPAPSSRCCARPPR